MRVLVLVYLWFFSCFLCASDVFLFVPEFDSKRVDSFKSDLQIMLSEAGNYNVEIINSKDHLSERISTNPSSIFIVSSYYYKPFFLETSFQPLLVGEYKGSKTHTKVFLTKKETPNIELLSNTAFSSVGMEGYLRSILSDILLSRGQSDISQSVLVTTVPKEMDALINLSFGMIKSCLVSQDTISQFAQISAQQLANLKYVAQSKPIFNPLIIMPSNVMTNNPDLFAFFNSLATLPAAQKMLSYIGIETLKPILESEQLLLKGGEI